MTELQRRLQALGTTLLAGAGLLGLLALRHMAGLAAYGPICGRQPHCLACPASVAAAVAGLTALALAARGRAAILG